ncbi:MAG: hypothetical protein JXJ04_07880 [Spirochaetales bacterium]|nr:hypothetical protein [Spirochaetales bacterium]
MYKLYIIILAVILSIMFISCNLFRSSNETGNEVSREMERYQEAIGQITSDYRKFFNQNPSELSTLSALYQTTRSGNTTQEIPLQRIEAEVIKRNNKKTESTGVIDDSIIDNLVLYNHINTIGTELNGDRIFFVAGDFVTPEAEVQFVTGLSLNGEKVMIYGNDEINEIEFVDSGKTLTGSVLEEVTIFVVAINERGESEKEEALQPDNDLSRQLADNKFIYIKKEYMTDDEEPWYKGKPEVFCVILTNYGVLSCKNMSWFDKIKTYYYEKVSICEWNRDDLGNYLTFVWIEDDYDWFLKTIGISGSTDKDGKLIVFPTIVLDCYPASQPGGFTDADQIMGSISIKYSENDNISYTADDNIIFSVGH